MSRRRAGGGAGSGRGRWRLHRLAVAARLAAAGLLAIAMAGLLGPGPAQAALPAPAQAPAPASVPAPVPAPTAGVEAFDPQASSATFTVVLRLSGPVPGRFSAIEGELAPAGDGLWRVAVRVDTRAMSLDGPTWMLRSTRSERFLDVERHPRIDFVSAPFARGLLREGGVLVGELGLRGLRRQVAFRLEPADCASPGRACPIRVRGEIDRRDFGMTSQRLWLRDTVGFEFRVRLHPGPRP